MVLLFRCRLTQVVVEKRPFRVSTTPGNPGNLLEFKNPPGNPGNLVEFNGPPGNFCVR